MSHTHLNNIKINTYKNYRQNSPVRWDIETNAWCIYKYQDIIDILLKDQIYTAAMGDQLPGISQFDKNYVISNEYSIHQNNKITEVFLKDIHEYFSKRIPDTLRQINIINNYYINIFKNKNINFTNTFNLLSSIDSIVFLLEIPDDISNLYKEVLLQNNLLDNYLYIKDKIEYITNTNIYNIPFYKYLIRNIQPSDIANITIQKRICSDFISSTMINAITSMCGAINIVLHSIEKHKQLFNSIDITLISSFIKESIRFSTLDARFARKAIKQSYINNQYIDIGDNIVLLTGSANFDESVFGEDTHEFNIHRPLKKITLEFGFGSHFCLAYKIVQFQINNLVNFIYNNKNLHVENIIYEEDAYILGSPIKEIYGAFIQ